MYSTMGAWILACMLLATFTVRSANSYRVLDVLTGSRNEKTVTSRPLSFYQDEDSTSTESYKTSKLYQPSKQYYKDTVVYPALQPLSYNFDHSSINNQLKYEPDASPYSINSQLKGIVPVTDVSESQEATQTDNEGQGFSETVSYVNPIEIYNQRSSFDLEEHKNKQKNKEVHYHQHKHLHEHDHKQEHLHKHKQEHLHQHKHGHKENAKHEHQHRDNHEHQHKAEHLHKQLDKHQHHHQGEHHHEHKQDHKHDHQHHQKHDHHQNHKHEHQHKNDHQHEHRGEHRHGHKHEHSHEGKHKHEHHEDEKHHHDHKHKGYHKHKHEDKHQHKHQGYEHKIYIKKYHH